MTDRAYGAWDRIRELCRRLKPILGPQMEKIFTAYAFEDAEKRPQIRSRTRARRPRNSISSHRLDIPYSSL